MADGKARLQPRWFIVSFWHVHRLVVRITKGRWGLWSPRPGKWGALRLPTTGRRSGEPRSVILGYFEDGDAMVSMAMNGWGAPEPMETKFAVVMGIAAAKLNRGKANDLVTRLLEKYESQIGAFPERSRYQECYDVATGKPKEEYVRLYSEVKEEFSGMGISF